MSVEEVIIISELYHHGVKGQKWGIRRGRHQSSQNVKTEKTTILFKKGENVALYKDPKAPTARFLASIMPSVKNKQDRYVDYTIRDKTGKSVGSVSTYKESNSSLNIVWLGVKSKNEGNGYGQSAMRIVVDQAKKDGYKHVTLEVPTNSPNARHIYEKIGFKSTGEKMLGDENDVWCGLTKMRLDL